MGIVIGEYIPSIPQALSKLTIANVNIPIAVLIWAMISPMMVKVDFSAIKRVHRGHMLKGLIVTWTTNWLIKPFSMFLISSVFIETWLVRYFLVQLHVLLWFLYGVILQTAIHYIRLFRWQQTTLLFYLLTPQS
ncbi:MAG: hypothetical protein J7L82_03965 [Staphylothermus sp.]|nr:hypothetical protein [Staphylothermus sp.]